MIFGINTTSDISKLLYLISRAVRRVKFETILKFHRGIDANYQVQIMLLFVYTTTHERFVIFTCGYFKLTWNTTALSQSNCRNLSCSSINADISGHNWGEIRHPWYYISNWPTRAPLNWLQRKMFNCNISGDLFGLFKSRAIWTFNVKTPKQAFPT